MQGFEFFCPTKIVCGANTRSTSSPDELAARGVKPTRWS